MSPGSSLPAVPGPGTPNAVQGRELATRIDLAMDMLRKGRSVSEVAERFETTTRTVRRWRQTRYPDGIPPGTANACPKIPPSGNSDSRTDSPDGQAGTDATDNPHPRFAADPDQFANDPQIVAVKRKAALERAEAERLRASLERSEAESDLREAVERDGLRLRLIRKVERDAHRRTYEALRRHGDSDVDDHLLLIELSAWAWQRCGGSQGGPYPNDAARAAAWARGYKSAAATDPAKPVSKA